jgi:hypothetical protein
MSTPKICFASLFLAMLLIHGLARSNPAIEPSLLISGVQRSGEGSFSYVGFLKPLMGGRLGNGWYSKASLSHLTYRYGTESFGMPVRATGSAPAIELGLGHVFEAASWRADVALATGARYTRVTPNTIEAGDRGWTALLAPQFALGWSATERVDAELIGNYTFGPDTYFGRSRVLMKTAPSWQIGAEAGQTGGPEHRHWFSGLVLATNIAPGTKLDVSAGRLHARGGAKSNYLALGISRTF